MELKQNSNSGVVSLPVSFQVTLLELPNFKLIVIDLFEYYTSICLVEAVFTSIYFKGCVNIHVNELLYNKVFCIAFTDFHKILCMMCTILCLNYGMT